MPSAVDQRKAEAARAAWLERQPKPTEHTIVKVVRHCTLWSFSDVYVSLPRVKWMERPNAD